MKVNKFGITLLSALALSLQVQGAQFFRVSGPVTSIITDFTANGYIVWSNAPTNGTFAIQTTKSLPDGSNWVDFVQLAVSNSVTSNQIFAPNPPAGMVLIPAGSFTMGATTNMGHESYSAETPQHSVYVSAFYMDRYEVTKSLWDSVYQWATNHGYAFDYSNSGYGKATNHPVLMVTWYDAVKWCNARSEKEGKTPAYYTNVTQTVVYRAGQVKLDSTWVKWNLGYRLPTEAEWEKAARGGVSGQRFHWGDTITHSQANYYSSSGYSYDTSPTRNNHPTFYTNGTPYTSPVGYFASNGYGLYDMAGNAWEWCWDWYANYSTTSQIDPRGPGSGLDRVFRGSSWDGYAIGCRSAYRNNILPTYRDYRIGFRSILPLSQ
jgi:formylglycine-generating enzyme required for sulfatase activity